MTQTPLRPKKHEGFDRTADFSSRVKMSQELAQVINDGLVYYEENHEDDDEVEHEKSWIESKNVNLISQAEFDKLKPTEVKNRNNGPPPPPPNTLMTSMMDTPSKKSSHFYPVTKEPTTPSQVNLKENLKL